MKMSEILQKALESYECDSFMCNVIEDEHGMTGDVVQLLNLINRRLDRTYTLTAWLYENDSEYKALAELADPLHPKSINAMKNVYCYNLRVLYWIDLIEELQKEGK